jgi:hypothetical protein
MSIGPANPQKETLTYSKRLTREMRKTGNQRPLSADSSALVSGEK